MRKIFLIILLGGLIFPTISLAGTYMACHDTNPKNGRCDPAETYTMVYYEGLVPCGKGYCMGDNLNVKGLNDALAQGQNLSQVCSTIGGGTYKTFEIPGTRPGQTIEIGLPCTFCHLFVMFDGIIDFVLFQLVPPIAILMLVIAGALYMMAHFGGAEMLPGGARGGPAMLGQAKKVINSVVLGLLIIYAGWLVINLFFQLIGVAPWTGLASGWFSIKCPIALP